MKPRKREPLARAFEVVLLGAFSTFTAWAIISFAVTFGLVPFSLESLIIWTRATWVFLFLTLLFTLLAVGMGSWRRLPYSKEET